jgi:tetratricopeptide (TPR) repeat protein
MDKTMREMLSRGLVFELPVPRDALAAVCENIANLSDYISRAVALGLLEVSYDQALRVPRILPVQLAESGEALHKQAAEVLYRLWWEEAETSNEEQKLEIHRLALLGKVNNIAVKVAGNLANSWNWTSRFREAVKICYETIEIAQNYDVFHELARAEETLGNIENCAIHYQKALDLCPEDNEISKSAIINNLAVMYQTQGRLEEALNLHQQSLDVKDRIGDFQGKSTALHNMARIHIDRGQTDEGMSLLQKSLEISERIGFSVQQAATIAEMGILLTYQGKFSEALEKYEQVLRISREINNAKYEAGILSCIGDIYKDQGQFEEALTFYQQSLEIDDRIGNVYGKATTLHQLGILKANRGEIDDAIALYQQSLALNEQIGNVQGKATTLHCLGMLKANTGEIEDAIALYQESLAINEQIGNVQGKANTLWWLGHIAEQQGDYNQALDYLHPAWEILQRIQSPDAERLGQVIARVQGLATENS